MKTMKLAAVALATVFVMGLAGCSGGSHAMGGFSVKADTLEELEVLAEEDAESTVALLEEDFDSLQEDVDTYEKYLEGDAVEDFYGEVCDETEQFCIRQYHYALKGAELVVAEDVPFKEKCDLLEETYESAYEGPAEDFEQDVCYGLLEDARDYFYYGLIEDAQDSQEHSDWQKVRSDEYDALSGVESNLRSMMTDTYAEILAFYSDVATALLSGDDVQAEEKIEDFRAVVEEREGGLKGKTQDEEGLSEESAKEKDLTEKSAEDADSGKKSSKEADAESGDSAESSDIDPSFKAAMDSYEEFFDGYIEFMNKYAENPSDPSLLASYAEFMTQYTEIMEEMESWDDGSLNDAELAYYLDVTLRIEQKLLDAAV